jgi:superoxide dismutase
MSQEINKEEIEERFNKKVSSLTLQGWTIVDKNNKRFECVLSKKGNVNNLLHGFLTFMTCFWGIVWYLKYKEGKEQRIRISFDSSGNLIEEKVTS